MQTTARKTENTGGVWEIPTTENVRNESRLPSEKILVKFA